jgi:hypothetical protein
MAHRAKSGGSSPVAGRVQTSGPELLATDAAGEVEQNFEGLLLVETVQAAARQGA